MQLFREVLDSEGFIEIHTPKLLSGASEGGAAVFKFDYLGRPGCLAQVQDAHDVGRGRMNLCTAVGKTGRGG